MEFLGKVVEVVIDFVWKHGVRQVTYIIHYKKNAHELNDSFKHLGFEKERIDHQCDEAEKNLNNIEGRVTEWVKKVSEIETIVEEFENDDGHQRARSLNCYFFPYLWNRHRLGRQAKKMEEDVKKLIHESPKYDEVSYRQDVSSNDASLSNFGFVEFGSTKSIMEKVMTQLEDSTVRMIGLYGPGGVGKSTLIKEIAKKAKYKKLFDVVVNVEITANPNLQKVQEDIAYVLRLRLEGEGENVRADCLRRRLKREKGNTLIILDDLWDKLDLNKLGIPLDDDDDDDDDLSNDNKDLNRQKLAKKDDNKDLSRKVLKKEKMIGVYKGCKILLTSRDKNVLFVQMDVKSTFYVKELDDKDALMLFQKLVGIHNEMSHSKQEIVKKYCAGLPMAIVTVARALKSKSESVWEATLEKLKKEELVGVQTSMDISVKMSYDHLENEEIKSIFLLCAQMGHQPLIMDLVKYCFGLGILEGVSSLWEARDKIKTSIQKLKDSGLLLNKISNKSFNMHDMVRDAALSISHNDHNFFTLRNGKLDDWPELEKCTSISICNSDIIDGLPEVINCPQLKLFQIDSNDPSLEIPDNVFRGMENLRVLILIGFRLSSLPSSIKCLLKLRMFCLERCTLDCNLSILGELKKLRILSFSGSQLKDVPYELHNLNKLQLLDISDCSELRIIPPNLISKLTCLEELYIRESLIKMLVERETNKGQDLFLSEVENLHKLKVVDLSVPCASFFPNHLFFDNLKDYKIVIGDFELFSVGEFRMPDKYETFRVLALQLKDDIDIHSQENIKLLFKTVQSLLLGKIYGVQNVVNDLNMDGFPNLKHLSIINNNHIKYVNSKELCNYVNVFPNLESLCLYNLRNLEMICYGPVTVVSFSKLKIIKVEMCHRLRNLYSFFMVKFPASAQTCEISECNCYMDTFLANLETIEVSECRFLKEILQISMHYGKIKFLKLRTLTLRQLPSFTCFYTTRDESSWSQLTESQTTNRGHRETTSEEDEQSEKTTPLFGDLFEIPNLESLSLSSLNIHRIWSDQHFIFQNLIKLVVKDCDKLTYLCSLSMASSLNKLKSLIISDCPFMKKIFKVGENSAYKVCVFPKLEEIDLSKMNRLTDIWETKVSVDSFSSLISMNIEECNKLDKIFPSHMEGWIECLDNLKVSRCKLVEVIFEINDSQEIDAFVGINTNLEVILLEDLPRLKQLWSMDPDGILNFKKLRKINVVDCDELRNLFPASVAKDVPKLECMSASSCSKMEEIVANQHASEANKDPLVFPELTYVRLDCLPNIKHFYKQSHPIKCPKLKELCVYNCKQLKTFLSETCKATNEEVLPNLEYMEIDFEEAQKLLPKYEMHRLKELRLISVKSVHLLYEFPFTMPNLEKLELYSWDLGDGITANIPRQKRLGMVLQLKELVLLNSNIKDLELGRVLEGVPALRRLELLSLVTCHRLTKLCPSSVSFTYMTSLKLKNCYTLRNLMASSTAKTMVQLQTMKVIRCHNLKQIVSNEGSEEGKVMKIVFSKLISVELVGLEEMTSFCSNKECEFEFPSLEIVIVRECPKMEKFSERESIAPKLKNVFGVEGDQKAKWHWEGHLNATIQKVFNDKLTFAYSEYLSLEDYTEYVQQLRHGPRWVHQNSFGYLKMLRAWGCDTVEHVIPSHLLSCFHNLEVLHVFDCKAAQFIFNINDEDRLTKASGIFRLKTLSLYSLPKLEHVWEKDPEGIIGLQLLKEMCVGNCESLKSLFPASVAKDLTRLQVLDVTECEELAEIFRKDEKGEEGETTTQDFAFPRLTSLTLERLPRLTIHWSKQEESILNLSERDIQELCLGSRPISNSSFNLLNSLIVDDCQFLSDVFLPLNLLPFLTNLETLKVRKCDSVKAIFDVKCTTQGRDMTSIGETLPFSLKTLTLSLLPNLENVWNGDPHGILSMRHLQEVHVEDCEGLTSVFPASVAKDIVELKNLVVKNCEGLMTIVAEDNRDPGIELTFPCPRVRSLNLQGLSKLKYFYYCSLKSHIYTHLESHTVEQLECLSLGENGVKMILRGELQRNLLDNLRALTLYFSSNEFEYEFLKQVPNTEKLVVCDGSFKKMFCCESPNNVDYSGLLLQLKILHLKSLKNLVSIGLENSWAVVKNLETFEVISFSSLENLVSCKVSFSNLICLKVKSCDRLSYLFTSSTARSLTQLKRIKIKECQSIKEIVFKEEEEKELDEIMFPNLSCLILDSLSHLRRFYKGSLSFPILEELSVKKCNEMVTLCAGTIETNKLSQITINYDEGIPLKNNLNFTMRKNFLKQDASSRKQSLKLRDRADLQDILQNPDLFNDMKTLILDGCHISSYVLPFALLPLLPLLETLEVRNCHSIKTIFDVQCPQNRVTVYLETLVLWELPNLESVWKEDPGEIVTDPNPADPKEINPKLTFFWVTSLTLWDLPKFKHNTVHSIHDATAKLITPNLEHLTVGENELKMIVDGEFQRNLLVKLKALTLFFPIECDEFSDYGFLQQLPNVNKLVVCSGSFKFIFCLQRPLNSEHLLQLKELRLESLGELVSIGLENSWTEPFVKNLETFEVISCSSLKNLVSCKVSFSNLICLKVESCDGLSCLFTSSTAQSLAQLKRMEIKECESIEEIVSKEEGEESDEDEIIFPKLSHLILYKLLKLRKFFEGSLSFPLLEELSVTNCNEMQTLCGGTVKTDQLSQGTINYDKNIGLEIDPHFTMIKNFLEEVASWKWSLELRDRADLQEIWRVSLQIPHLCFRFLKTLIVEGCHFSSYALPFTLLPSLPQLETFEVRNCHSLKTIFDVQCPQNTVASPMKTLVLWKLPNLESVWNEDTGEIVTETNPKLTFPTLTSLTLWDLPKFKHNTIHSIHHATAKLITPNLEHLTVGENELKMIVVGEFQRNLLDKLKVVTLYSHIECDEFSDYGFLQHLPNVKKLVVCGNSVNVIFCHQRPDNSEHLLQLKELRLESLGELVSIGLENSWTLPFVKNLKIFEVISCSRLKNLVSCRVSFSNLICLKVESCDGLSCLFTSSTAQNLPELQRMEIEKCESIEEIVSKKEGEESDEDEIIFPKLSHLNLYKLLKLKKFYGGSLSFPLLEELSVKDCDKIKTLCGGPLKTDKLSQVTIDDKDIPLKTDLNSTMRKEFEKRKNIYSSSSI